MTLRPLRIARLGQHTLERLLAGAAEGRVHSVFERAINVLWHDGRLLTLHGQAPLAAPFAIAVHEMPPRGAATPGMRIALSDFGWAGAETVPLGIPRGALAFAFDALPSPLPSPALRSGSGFCARQELGQSLAAGNLVAFADAAWRLIGLGEGLTPSGDDCIVGALAAIHRLAPEWLAVNEVPRDRLAAAAASRTTDVARDFLLEAIEGRFAEPVQALVTAVSDEAASRAARELEAMGATSGADTLSGILLACRALTLPAVAS